MAFPESIYDITYKVIVFGDTGVGKTTLLNLADTVRVSNPTNSITIGVEWPLKDLIVNGKKIKLQIWEFNAAERFKFLIPTYAKGAKGGIFMYDVSNHSSLEHIDYWLEVVRKEIKEPFPIIVVGCKADIEECEVSTEEGFKIAKSRGMNGFLECSSITGKNVKDVLKTITKIMLQRSDFYK